MAVPITDWYDSVLIYTKDADVETDVFDKAIRDTIRDFCRFTHLWKQNHDRIDMVSGTARYALTPPTDQGDATEIAGVDVVKFKQDGMDDDQFYPLKPTSREYLDSYDVSWEFREGTTPWGYFYDHLTEELVLVDIPGEDSTGGILPRVWLMPAVTATEVPNFLFQKYEEDISYGVAGYLMRMSNRRWHNQELAAVHWKNYLDRRSNAQQDHDLGFTDREDYVAMPEPGFSGGSRGRSWTF